MTYIRKDGPAGSGEWIEHLDGIDWYYAPTPRRWHRCWPQTRGWMDHELVERCACGSLRFDGYGPWIDRNRCERLTPQQQAERMAERDRSDALDALIRQFHEAEKADDRARMKEICEELRKLEPA